jgi:hypothetical protein
MAASRKLPFGSAGPRAPHGAPRRVVPAVTLFCFYFLRWMTVPCCRC